MTILEVVCGSVWWRVAGLLGLFLFLSVASPATAKMEKASMQLANGSEVRYRVILPDGYDSEKEYPAVLAFAGGPQDARTTDWGLQEIWRRPAEERGYLVFSPIADSQENMFIGGGTTIFPEFLDQILSQYKVRDGKFHVTGFSNGGISAFLIAAMNPQYFSSVLTIAGYVGGGTEPEYAALRDMCIVMIAGERDRDWAALAQRDVETLRAMGRNPYLEIVPRQGHIPKRYTGKKAAKLFDLIESGAGC